VLVGPDSFCQVCNGKDAELLRLIIGAPEELEFLSGANAIPNMSVIYPTDPTQMPNELAGLQWPRRG